MAKLRLKLIAVPWDLEVPTLALASLAAVTPPQFDISIVDVLREHLFLEEPVDLVGITASTPSVNAAYAIADAYRARGVKVVMGGHHATALPEEALTHCDAVVVGEGETSWRRLCDEFLGNPSRVQGIYRDAAPDLASLPQPRIDLMKIERYGSFFYPLIASRGCPESCSFCFSKRMTRGFRTYPISHVIEQVRRRPSFIRAAYFVDDNLMADLDYARELFKELKRVKLPFGMQARAEVANNPDDLRLAYEAGCTLMSSGYESVVQDSLDGTGKRTGADGYKPLIAAINASGIIPAGNWMFGFDWDTPDVFQRTLDFIDSTELGHCSFTSEIPFPGTASFKRYEREGRILTRDYDRYSGKDEVVFRPKQMTPEQLRDGVRWVTHGFYSAKRATKRLGRALREGKQLAGVGPRGLRAPALVWLNYSQAMWWRAQQVPSLMAFRRAIRPWHQIKHVGDYVRGTNFHAAPFKPALPPGDGSWHTQSPFLHVEGLKPSRQRPLAVSGAERGEHVALPVMVDGELQAPGVRAE